MTAAALSPSMQTVLSAAREGRLYRFRVGWAHDKLGPFFRPCTVFALVARGQMTITPGGKHASVPKVRPSAIVRTMVLNPRT